MLSVSLKVADAYVRPVLHFVRFETHGYGPINTWHCHDLYHVVYIVEGEGVFRLDDQDVPARPRRLFIIGPKQWHQFLSVSETFCYDVLTFELRKENGKPWDRPFWELFEPPHRERFCQALAGGVLDVPERLHPWIRSAFGAAMPPAHGSGESQYIYDFKAREEVILVTFLQDLAEILDRIVPRPDSAPRPSERRFHRRVVDQAVRLINENVSSPMTVDELARRFHLHPVYFSQIFKAEMGLPPRQYLLQLRLNHARRLLAETDMPISDVARACGFRTVAYFSRAFREAEGMSPTAFRVQSATITPRLFAPS